MRPQYPRLLYDLAIDMFSAIRCWKPPTCSAVTRGRLFEELFYRYCARKQLPLSETAGSRTLDGAYSGSGFLHESDGVLTTPEINVHIELKHRKQAVTKLDVVSFNQKGLDFLVGENPTIRQRPLYRILVSASELCWEARVFASQWGIITIEPRRLPLLTLHDFVRGKRQEVVGHFASQAKEIEIEVPYFIASTQERLRRVVSILDINEAVLGAYRIERMLRHLQEEVGSRVWRMMDRLNSAWIKDRYHSAFVNG